ncbi:MAG: endonuclease/exonuclease/phosphatase family protein [Kofleriaceae bacterium]
MSSLQALQYNVHLFEGTVVEAKPLPPPTVYEDAERALAIIGELLASGADLIGLTEVWANATKLQFIDGLKSSYLHSYWDGNDNKLQLGSGLLLLSKYPLSSMAFSEFANLTGVDALSQKGFITAMVATPSPLFVVLTHTQSGETDDDRDARQLNLAQLAKEIPHTRPPDVPTLLMGDLNVIAETTSGQPCPQYESLLAYFHSFSVTDVYRTLHPDASQDPGYTYDAVDNRLIAIFAPTDTEQGLRQRLDYLFAAGLTARSAAQLSTTYQYQDSQTGEMMDLSDHYPLLCSFTLP